MPKSTFPVDLECEICADLVTKHSLWYYSISDLRMNAEMVSRWKEKAQGMVGDGFENFRSIKRMIRKGHKREEEENGDKQPVKW